MSKFVIWDDVDKSFRNDFKDFIGINTKGQLYSFKHNIEINEEYSIYYDIGLKDIKGKNIYANCSIVEFELNINKEEVKIIGYFSYIKEELRYEFYQHFKQREKFIKTYLSPSDSRLTGEFKIIDTIQENKLGLIK